MLTKPILIPIFFTFFLNTIQQNTLSLLSIHNSNDYAFRSTKVITGLSRALVTALSSAKL